MFSGGIERDQSHEMGQETFDLQLLSYVNNCQSWDMSNCFYVAAEHLKIEI